MEHVDRAPDEVTCEGQVFSLAFHPTADVFAAGIITGKTQIFRYSLDGPSEQVLNLQHCSGSCRDLVFETDGSYLYTVSSDKSLCAIDQNGALAWGEPAAHETSINRIHHLAPYMLATGDDAGCVKIWDIRMAQAVAEHKVHEDYVADMVFDPERHTLVSVSGDATLAAYDMRQQKVEGRSDEQEDELHSVCIIKHGKKLVCGSQDGVLLVFHWGRWGDCTDRFPGHPDSVDAMVKIDESTIATGSSDGLIRVVQIQPNKHIGVIGDMQNFPVEGIKYSRDKLIIGTYAHDEIIRFWDTSFLLEDEDETKEEEELEDEKEEEEEAGTGEEKGEQPMMERGEEEGGQEVWEDVSDEDDSDEDDDDDDDDSSVDSLDKEYEKRVKNRLRRGREKFYDGL